MTIQAVSSAIGEGNVVTTTANLSRWIRRLLRGEAGIDAKQVARMRECVATGDSFVAYGLGLECHPAAFGQGHNGGNPGYLTVARHDVDADVTVVLFTTLADYDDACGGDRVAVRDGDESAGRRRVLSAGDVSRGFSTTMHAIDHNPRPSARSGHAA